MNDNQRSWIHSIVIVAGFMGVIIGASDQIPVLVVFGMFAISIGSFLAGYRSALEDDGPESLQETYGAEDTRGS